MVSPRPWQPPVVVTGFGRCGSTMAMAVLRAGGVPWSAGASPTTGEYESIAAAAHSITPGRATKLLIGRRSDTELIAHAARVHGGIRIVHCVRDHLEQARSAYTFAVELHLPLEAGERAAVASMRDSYRRDEPALRRALRKIGSPLEVNYTTALTDPVGLAARLAAFLPEYSLDQDAAAAAVHHRSPRNLPGEFVALEITHGPDAARAAVEAYHPAVRAAAS